ncbi:MAG TPA: hypothetical protein PKA30_03510 [Accumulibacter sp.]|uniref:hypothetical protein n=1 Tax=Accumulibacter sp. TaxID=2053492 RepID=UPI0026091BB2|nr:hypothetical protein [Accumulibacter sp.]MDS4054773.1 hypothetical protein [Accumulibacter sp.]HMV04597.1 hypothetical protein [Accumulibacter sp.]HMW63000.1 hypothetical protein [Accumulibacter sp.]HMW81850.1 hypothetical protein [Accumulibacter sp.]HNB66752.1 hypothetical protein [Accumulibacter sp.]
MEGLLLLLGRAAGVLGLLVCVVAGAVRLSGSFYLAGFQVGTLLQTGIGLVVVACFLLLLVATGSGRSNGAGRWRG